MAHSRSVISLLLALLLFCSTTGVAAVHHYCGGKLDSVSILGSTCPCGQKHKKNKCCDQKVVLHKLQSQLLKQHNKTDIVCPIVVSLVVVPILLFEPLSTAYTVASGIDLPPPADIPIRFRSLLL